MSIKICLKKGLENLVKNDQSLIAALPRFSFSF